MATTVAMMVNDSGYDGYDGSSSGSGYDDDDYDYSNSY